MLYFAIRLPHISNLPIWGYDEGCYLSVARAIADGDVNLLPTGAVAPAQRPAERPADAPPRRRDDAPDESTDDDSAADGAKEAPVGGNGATSPAYHGAALLYVDVAAVHPPGLFALESTAFRIFGSLTAVRVAYVAWCFVTVVCVLAIARALLGAEWGWIASGIYVISPLVATHYGQRVYLEPLACPLMYVGVALLVGRYRGEVWALVLAGALSGLAATIKYPAVLVGIGALAGLVASGRRVRSERMWGLPLLAALLLFAGVTLGPYLQVPGFLEETIGFQGTRPYQLATNLTEMGAAVGAMPVVLPLGLIGCGWLAHKRRSRARIVGSAGLVVTVVTCAVAREFYARHLILALPLLVVGASAVLQALWRRPEAGWRAAAAALVAVTLVTSLRPIAGYMRHGERSAEQECLIRSLAAQQEPVFTLDPIYTLEANRQLPQWRLAYDAFPAFATGKLDPRELRTVVDACPTVAMNVRTEHELPGRTLAYIRAHYRVVAQDAANGASVMVRRSRVSPLSAAP